VVRAMNMKSSCLFAYLKLKKFNISTMQRWLSGINYSILVSCWFQHPCVTFIYQSFKTRQTWCNTRTI